jgi:hypothetical protein
MWKLIIAGALVATTAAVAQSPVVTTKRGVDNDPNKMVCVQERVIGSRLNTRRVCRTRAEWAEHRAETRREVEESQYFKPTFCDTGNC